MCLYAGGCVYKPLTTALLCRGDFEKRVVIQCMNNVIQCMNNVLQCMNNVLQCSAGRYTEYIVIPRYYLCTVLIPADFFLYRDIVISRYSLRFDRYFK